MAQWPQDLVFRHGSLQKKKRVRSFNELVLHFGPLPEERGKVGPTRLHKLQKSTRKNTTPKEKDPNKHKPENVEKHSKKRVATYS